MIINKCVIVMGFLVLADASQVTSRESKPQILSVGNFHDHPQKKHFYNRPQTEESFHDSPKIRNSQDRSSTLPDRPFDRRARAAQDNEYTIPVTRKAGALYYDLARAETTDVVLEQERTDVWGVTTADSDKCQVETLVLSQSLVLDPVVATSCPLHNVTLIGELLCYRILDWVKLLPDVVHFHEVECLDMRCHKPTKEDEENLVFCKLTEIQDNADIVNTKCPEVCERCIWYVYKSGITLTVRCHDANLTDADLPVLPALTTNLLFDNNRIRSVERLMTHLEGYKKLTRLVVSRNKITNLPNLPMGTFGRLVMIDLTDNNITELDVKAAESLFSRKGLQVKMEGNLLRCGCHLYHVNQLYLKYCGDLEKNPCINIYTRLGCFSESDNKTMPIYDMNYLEGCREETFHFNYWHVLNIILTILTLLMAWLIIDIIVILLNFNGTKYLKRPKMDYIVCYFSQLAEIMWPVSQAVEQTDQLNIADSRS